MFGKGNHPRDTQKDKFLGKLPDIFRQNISKIGSKMLKAADKNKENQCHDLSIKSELNLQKM